MNTENYLLACISEEAGEVVQAVGKGQRFGLMDVNEDTGDVNLERLILEVHDLLAVYEMLCAEINISYEIDKSLLDKKKLKVEKFMKYSKEKGIL